MCWLAGGRVHLGWVVGLGKDISLSGRRRVVCKEEKTGLVVRMDACSYRARWG